MAHGAGAWLDRLPSLHGHSFSNAPCASNVTGCPIVLYSHGATGQRAEAAPRAEDLASHGYVVVAPDHFDAFNTLWPDGF